MLWVMLSITSTKPLMAGFVFFFSFPFLLHFLFVFRSNNRFFLRTAKAHRKRYVGCCHGKKGQEARGESFFQLGFLLSLLFKKKKIV